MISVLVVDDDFMVADVHRRLVERHPGYRVVGVAHSAGAAMRAVKELDPDLVVLDMYLPDRNGVDLLGALRSAKARCEVIAITAARDPETVAAVMRLGALRYLVKPFDPAALTAQLSQVLELFEAADSLGGSNYLNQDQIDSVFASRQPAPAQLPKGLSPVTLDRILSALSVDDARSAAEVAVSTGVSRASARRYLEHLVMTGRSELTMRYGTTGRPEHRFRRLADR